MYTRILSQKIYRLDIDGNIINEIKDTAGLMQLGVNYKDIARCLCGYRKTYKGFVWCYERDLKKRVESLQIKDRILCLDGFGNIIKTYKILKDVIYDGFWDNSVCECIKGKKKTHNGLYWCLEKDYENKKNEICGKIIDCYMDGKLIESYTCAKEIIESGYNYSSVSNCLANRQKTYRGMIWKHRKMSDFN